MTAALVLDDPGWEYPGGACRLRVWSERADGWMLAVLHEDPDAGGVSVANAMEGILAQLTDEWAETYGDRPMVVQHTGPSVLSGDEWHSVVEINDTIRWEPTTPEAVAEDLGVPVAEVLP